MSDLYCWGDIPGAVAPYGDTIVTTPTKIAGVGAVQLVALGRYHTCIATGVGGDAVQCWGRGGWLGDGTTTDSDTPVSVKW